MKAVRSCVRLVRAVALYVRKRGQEVEVRCDARVHAREEYTHTHEYVFNIYIYTL